MRINTANRIKIAYKNKVFRGKLRVFNTRIAILKKYML